MTGTEAYRRPPTAPSNSSNRKARQQAAPDGFRLKTARGALITASLPSLQNLIKRSSESYAEEFAAQWARFGSQVKIVQLGLVGAKADEENLREVTGFVCQVAHLYPSLTGALPSILSGLLLSSAPTASTSSLNPSGGANVGISGGGVQLGPETRKTMMQGLVLLRRRDVISGVDLLKTLFPLLSMTTSPNLRSFILKTILGDIKEANLRTKNHKLNRMVQGLLFGMIDRGISAESERLGTGVKASRRGDVKIVGAREAMWAVKIASELWRKNVWRDSKTVSIVASACFHPDTKVQSAAIHFFLVTPEVGEKADDADSDDEDNEGPDIKTVKHRQEINKKRKSSDRRAKREIKNANGRLRQAERMAKEPSINFSALQLLQDPQTFGEKLYGSLVKYDRSYTLDHKVLIMSLFGRVSSTHKLSVLSFYSYVIKYLTHHQLQITAILVALAQSVHDLTPPDELTPVVKKLAGEFVHGGVAAEVNAAGLNAITEICRRQPWCMERELLEDLVEYKMSKDKGVMVASRGLLQLYREVNPGLLKRRERGKVASMAGVDAEPLQYGESRDAATGIEGLDLLAKHLAEKEKEGAAEGDEEEDWKEWEVESDGSESSGGWNDVSSDGESDFEVADSDEDEDEVDARRKRRRLELEEKKANKRAKGVEVAGTKAVEDEIKLGEDSEEEDSDGDKEEEESVARPKVSFAVADEDEDEMSLTRANKVLAGTEYVDLATTKILTPADFVKINELRTAAAQEEAKNGGGGAARRKLAALSAARKANTGESDNFLSEGTIIGVQKKAKNSYEERLAMIAEGREGREKFGSNKHKKLGEKEHSTTNEEKRKKKAFAMVASSRSVRKKNTSSLQQKSKKLRNHIDRIKRGGRRGNNG